MPPLTGISKGLLAFSPYEISLGELTSGEHLLELTVFGNRINTFGTLHNCNFSDNWCGPDNWRTTGEEWSYEYQINPFGLLKAPILRIKDRIKNPAHFSYVRGFLGMFSFQCPAYSAAVSVSAAVSGLCLRTGLSLALCLSVRCHRRG